MVRSKTVRKSSKSKVDAHVAQLRKKTEALIKKMARAKARVEAKARAEEKKRVKAAARSAKAKGKAAKKRGRG